MFWDTRGMILNMGGWLAQIVLHPAIVYFVNAVTESANHVSNQYLSLSQFQSTPMLKSDGWRHYGCG